MLWSESAESAMWEQPTYLAFIPVESNVHISQQNRRAALQVRSHFSGEAGLKYKCETQNVMVSPRKQLAGITPRSQIYIHVNNLPPVHNISVVLSFTHTVGTHEIGSLPLIGCMGDSLNTVLLSFFQQGAVPQQQAH